MVSPDREFAPVGDRTKIKYRNNFNKYKKILIQGKNSKSICALFDWYNTALLDNHGEDAQPHNDGSDDDGSEILLENGQSSVATVMTDVFRKN